MSGLAVAYGKPTGNEVRAMLKKIEHRGPYLSGVYENKQVMMAQNYLRADIGAPELEEAQVPVAASQNEGLRICYDGQFGNQEELSGRFGIRPRPFGEERLLLHLYRQYGKDMLSYLDDAIFAFVISDGDRLLAARDLLGIKTLFYGWKDGTLYLATELKSLVTATDEVYEFPPGHFMDGSGRLTPFAGLPEAPPGELHTDLDQMVKDIRDIIKKSVQNRVNFSFPTAGLLSGGMDSSVINYLASQLYREKFGQDARLQTFAVGVGDSGDIQNARVMAAHINSEHQELIVDLEQILEVLPQVVYYLESFDPSLVRSSVSNYLVSRYAREHGAEVLLSGEGGDEIFCGYMYLKDFPAEELFRHQMECFGFLHNNASLRLDRMNHCNSVRVVAPLISGELFQYSLRIPGEYKLRPEAGEKVEKWIFRKAYEGILPEVITGRLKQEFSQGSGSAGLLPAYFDTAISDEELAEARSRYPIVRSKEELYYFRIFTENFGEDYAVKTVGQWTCL